MKTLFVVALFGVVACTGPAGPAGATGKPGDPGAEGANGEGGTNADGGPSRDGGTADPPATAGTRLRPQYARTTTATSDGAHQVVTGQSGWLDTRRSEQCTFYPASDGKSRCLPIPSSLIDYSGGTLFADAACTQVLAFTAKASTCAPPTVTAKYLYASVSNAGCSGYTIRPIGTLVTPTAIYVKSGASCIATTAGATYDYYAPGGTEIAPTEFVEAATTTTLL